MILMSRVKVGIGFTLCIVVCFPLWIRWTTDVLARQAMVASPHSLSQTLPTRRASSSHYVSRMPASRPARPVTPSHSLSGKISSRSTSSVTSSHNEKSYSRGGNGSWKVQNGGRDKESGNFTFFPDQSPFLYSYSAFWDDRGSPMEAPVMRILTIAEQMSFEKHPQLQCLVSCRNGTKMAMANVTVIPFKDPNRRFVFDGQVYVRFVATCPMVLCNLGETRISIGPPSSLTPESSSVPVEIPRKPENPMEIGVCTSLSYWHIDPIRAVEWLEMQRILGVGGVVIYNDSLDAAVSEVFRHYDQTDFVDLRQCHSLFDPSSRYDIRIRSALTTTDCLYRHMYTFRNVMVIDTDEFIYPVKHRDLPALMDKLRSDTSHDTVNWSFENAEFLFDEDLHPNIDVTKPRELTFLRHRQHLPITRKHTKSIINPMICLVAFNHLCRVPNLMNAHTKFVLSNDGYTRHYRNTLCGDKKAPSSATSSCRDKYSIAYSVRDDSILRYQDDLAKAVFPKLKSLGLLGGN